MFNFPALWDVPWKYPVKCEFQGFSLVPGVNSCRSCTLVFFVQPCFSALGSPIGLRPDNYGCSPEDSPEIGLPSATKMDTHGWLAMGI